MSFTIGHSNARGGCCGKPVGCTSASAGCLHKIEKKAWQARAFRPYTPCALCGEGPAASWHLPQMRASGGHEYIESKETDQ